MEVQKASNTLQAKLFPWGVCASKKEIEHQQERKAWGENTTDNSKPDFGGWEAHLSAFIAQKIVLEYLRNEW